MENQQEFHEVHLGAEGEAQRLVPDPGSEPFAVRLRRWLTSWTVVLIEIGLLFSALILVGLIAYRWMLFGILCVKRTIFKQFDRFWELLDWLSPSPTVVVREEKQTKVRKMIEEAIEDVVGSYIEFAPWKWLTLWEMLGLLTCVTILVVAFYYSVRGFVRNARRVVMRTRGVRLESVRAGSTFVNGVMPTCQVAIKSPGIFGDKHLGYGVRCGSFLVTPRHVLMDKEVMMTEAVLVGTKSKVLTTLVVERSKMDDDLVYVYLHEKIWSLMGVSNGKWSTAKSRVSMFCQTFGQNGVSTGRIQKTSVRWQLGYTGSTIPGMSGTAYINGNQIFGIHVGAMTGYNIGICSLLIASEIKYIMKPESANGDYEDAPAEYQARFTNSDKIWDEARALEALERRYAEKPWLTAEEDNDDFYNQRLDFGESTRNKSDLNAKKVPTVTLPANGGIKIQNQAGDGTGSVRVMITEDDSDYLRTLSEARILERVARLESAFQKIMDAREACGSGSEPVVVTESAKPVVKPVVEKPVAETPEVQKKEHFKCSLCVQTAKTSAKLQNHMRASHNVKQESAIAEDTGVAGKRVKQGRFLGMRPVSPRNSARRSNGNSNSLVENRRSPSQAENLSALADSQRNIEHLLRALLEVMPGRVSVETLN